MKYYTQPLDASRQGDWNRVIANSSETGLFHEIEMVDFIAADRHAKSVSFLIYNNNNEPVGICPLFLHRSRNIYYFPVRGLSSFGATGSGPAFIDGFNDDTRRGLFLFLSEYLKCEVAIHHCSFLHTAVASLSDRYISYRVNPLLEMRGFRDMSDVIFYLDLCKTEDELFRGLEKRTRLVLKKDPPPFSIRRLNPMSSSDMKDAYALHTNAHGGNLVMSYCIFARYYTNPYSRAFIAYNGSVPVAVINFVIHKKTGLYWLFYITDDAIHTGLSTWMLWGSILDAKNTGVKHLSLGSQHYASIGSHWDALSRYKRSFGGELRYRYMVEYKPESKFYALARGAKKVLMNG